MRKLNFEINPTIVENLGRNLYSSDSSIIVELIANSYDADAKEVYINYDVESDFIEIADNGIGMDLETINNGFLKVGNINAKKPQSKLGRSLLGRKGIGKLSFFAIGDIVKVETTHNFTVNSFELEYEKLMNNEKSVYVNTDKQTSIINSQTKIKITKLLKGTKKDGFFKKMVIGIYHIFYNLFDENFKIFITNRNYKENNNKKPIVNFLLQKEENDFSRTLIFYSFDKLTDNRIVHIKNKAKGHLNIISNKSNLEEIKISNYSTSDNTYKLINNHLKIKKFKDKNPEINYANFQIKGYLAAIVTTRNILKSLKKDSQNNDEFRIENNKIIIKESNRRIKIGANGRVCMLNSKADLNLQAKFYTKYLFGDIDANFLEDRNSEDMTQPNREGYNKNDSRWQFLKTNLQIIGDTIMNFSNNIANLTREKIIKNVEDNILNYRIEYSEKIKKAITEKERQELIQELITELSRKKKEMDNEQKGFILISYKSKKNKSESQWSEKKAKIFCRILDKIIAISNQNIRVLHAGCDKYGKKTYERLYLLIKEEMYKSEKNYHRFHTFAFINDSYINNWFTDIEYGMSFANSRMSNHKLPKDITIFIEDKETLKNKINKFDPISFDDILNFDKKNILKKIKEVFKYILNSNQLLSENEEHIKKIIDENLNLENAS